MPTNAAARPRSRRSIALCVFGVVVFCSLDLASKAWAADNLSEASPGAPPLCTPSEHGLAPPQRTATRRVSLVDDHLEFHYTENCGASFGLLRNASPLLKQVVFGGAAAFACIVLLWMFAKGHGGVAFGVAVPLIVAGALGNLINRVTLGYVVDFIRLYWTEPLPLLGRSWPTINVADVTITIGMALLVIDARRRGRGAGENAENAPIPA